MKFDDMLYGVTTIIEASVAIYKSQGSGFFYNILSDKDPQKGDQWRKIEGTWLITNRHVALPKVNDKETVPDQFTFNLRQVINDKVEWLPISLDKAEYIKRLKIHTDAIVDVAAIDIGDIISQKLASKTPLMNFTGLTSDNLPCNSKPQINTGDDILVAGYPRGFYDKENKFPIVKTGIISSKWGSNFNGRPLFLIDSKLFPGSSGSLVISKPQALAVIDDKVMFNKAAPYIFLGIYSGEPILKRMPIELEGLTIIKSDSYNVGNVWYSFLVPEIIEKGVAATI